MPTFHRNGVEFYYEREGAGPPLLLVSGLLSDVTNWQPVRAALAARYDVIAFDNRCSGRTVASPVATSRDVMLDDCLAVLDHLDIPAAHIVGYSLGGMVGLHLAARHPARVISLVAAGCGATFPPGQIALFDDMAALYCASCVPRQQWFRMLFQWLFSPSFFDEETRVANAVAMAESYEHIQSPAALRAQVAALRDFAAPPDLAAIRTPVLGLAGDNDLLFPLDDIRTSLAGLPGLSMVTIPRAAHALHWEAPEAFIAAIVAFHAELAVKA